VPVTSWVTSARSATASSDGPDGPDEAKFPNIEYLGQGYDVIKGKNQSCGRLVRAHPAWSSTRAGAQRA
jgi:hypothetical protein